MSKIRDINGVEPEPANWVRLVDPHPLAGREGSVRLLSEWGYTEYIQVDLGKSRTGAKTGEFEVI